MAPPYRTNCFSDISFVNGVCEDASLFPAARMGLGVQLCNKLLELDGHHRDFVALRRHITSF
jgi:hypothetical protein